MCVGRSILIRVLGSMCEGFGIKRNCVFKILKEVLGGWDI